MSTEKFNPLRTIDDLQHSMFISSQITLEFVRLMLIFLMKIIILKAKEVPQ